MAHEIHGTDRVVLTEGHPLSGMGNWHRQGTVHDWDNHGLDISLVHDVLGVHQWEVESVTVADVRRATDLAKYLVGYGIAADTLYDLAEQDMLAIPRDAIIEGHQGIACGDNAPHYFPTKAYNIVQNRELADLAEVFQEAARIERGVTVPILSTGTLRDRRLAFVSLGIPDDDALDGLPERGHALNLGTSHDGTTALVGCLASYIIVCANTFRASLLGTAQQEVKIRHTRHVQDELAQARMILRDMIGAATETDGAIARLLDTPLTTGNWFGGGLDKVLTHVYGEQPTEEGRSLTVWDNRWDAIREEYYSPHVPDEVRGTAWAAAMSLQGWEQHARTTRGRKGQPPRHRAAIALQRTVAGATDTGYPLTAAFLGNLDQVVAA